MYLNNELGKRSLISISVLESRATIDRVVELEVELHETVARGREMLVEGQDSVGGADQALSSWGFSWIDDIFSEEEDEDKDRQNEKRLNEDNPYDPASAGNIIDVENVIKAQKEETKDVPLAM